MNKEEALAKLLPVFGRYYNVNTTSPAEPFRAEAVFHLHNENYVFVKSAKIAEQDTNEYVFFAIEEELTEERFHFLKEKAWQEGLSRAVIGENHRNSDVSLYIIADRIGPVCRKAVQKCRLSKTYRLGFRGFSHFRVAAIDLTSHSAVHNYMGDILMRNIQNVFPDIG